MCLAQISGIELNTGKVPVKQRVESGLDYTWAFKVTAPKNSGKFGAVFSMQTNGVNFGEQVIFMFSVVEL